MFSRLFRATPPLTADPSPEELARFAAFIAGRTGGPVIDIGGAAADHFAAQPDSPYIGLGKPRRRPHRNAHFVLAREDSLHLPQAPGAVVLCHDMIERVPLAKLVSELKRTQPEAFVITAYDRSRTIGDARWTLNELEAHLRENGLQPAAGGYARGRMGKDLAMVVCRRPVPGIKLPKVVAIMTAFNEADIVRSTIGRLREHGVDVYLIDNWSEDDTLEIAKDCGVIGYERFPQEGATGTFDLHALLSRVEELSQTLEADWFVHHDADEVRMSPFEGTTLAEGIAIADAEGYNAIDFTVADFPPIDDSFETLHDVDRCFPGFIFGGRPGHFVQVKGWKKTAARVQLASGGGHNAAFEGRRTYPYKFLLRHYPVRSQAHGVRKVLRDRQQRWNAEERTKGWHHHYDAIAEDHNFLRDPADLHPYISDSHFAREFIVERLTGVGIPRS